MGWTFCDAWSTPGAVRDELRRSLVDSGWEIVAEALTRRGARYYAATKRDGLTSIFVAMIEGNTRSGYGYKDLDESMGPYGCEDCPLAVLDAASPIEVLYAHDSPDCVECGRAYATRWRADVRKYHATRKAAAKAKPGDTVVTHGGTRYRVTRHVKRTVVGIPEGKSIEYRIPVTHIAAIEAA